LMSISRLNYKYYYDYDPNDTYLDRLRITKSLGLIGTIGFETYLMKRFGIFGEYNFIYKYYWQKTEETITSERIDQENNRISESSDSSEGWSLKIQEFIFGIFVCF
jgi:outer membrane protein W